MSPCDSATSDLGKMYEKSEFSFVMVLMVTLRR